MSSPIARIVECTSLEPRRTATRETNAPRALMNATSSYKLGRVDYVDDMARGRVSAISDRDCATTRPAPKQPPIDHPKENLSRPRRISPPSCRNHLDLLHYTVFDAVRRVRDDHPFVFSAVEHGAGSSESSFSGTSSGVTAWPREEMMEKRRRRAFSLLRVSKRLTVGVPWY